MTSLDTILENIRKPRIMGQEHEYGVYPVFENRSDAQSTERLVTELFEPLRQRRKWFRNGGLLYRDVGDHPEYAGPECKRLRDLVAHDKAGEQLMDALGLRLEERLIAAGTPANILLLKNNIDSAGNTYGAHENYLVGRGQSIGRISDHLTPFLISRQLLVGAGTIVTAPSGETVYALSQRARFIHQATGVTTRDRGAISVKDEPHADKDLYRRLHIIVGDSNLSETTTMLKFGSTDLLLRMLEAGDPHRDVFGDLRLSATEGAYDIAMRNVSLDRTGRGLLRLERGTITALELQLEYLTRAEAFVDTHGLRDNVETVAVLELWKLVVRALETGDLSLIDRQIDWAIKLRLIEAYCKGKDRPLSDPKCASIDLRYHDIRADRGLYYLLTKRGEVARFSTDEAIRQAADTPPDTRATIRGRFVKRAEETRTAATVGWNYLDMDRDSATPVAHACDAVREATPTPEKVVLSDPYATSDPRVDLLMALMSRSGSQPSPSAVRRVPAASRAPLSQ